MARAITVTMYNLIVLCLTVVSARNLYEQSYYKSGFINYGNPYESIDRTALRRSVRDLNGEFRGINQRSIDDRGDIVIRRQLYDPQRDSKRPYQSDREIYEKRHHRPEFNPGFGIENHQMNQGFNEEFQNRDQRRLVNDESHRHRNFGEGDFNRESINIDNRRQFEPDHRRQFEPDHRRQFEPNDQRQFEPNNQRQFEPNNQRQFEPNNRRQSEPNNQDDFEKHSHRQGEEQNHHVLNENQETPSREYVNRQRNKTPVSSNSNKHNYDVNDESTTLSSRFDYTNSRNVGGNNGDRRYDTEKNDSKTNSDRDQTEITKTIDNRGRNTNTNVYKNTDDKNINGVTGDRWSWGMVNDTKESTNRNQDRNSQDSLVLNTYEQGNYDTNSGSEGHRNKPNDMNNSSGVEVETTTALEFPDRAAFTGDKCPTGKVKYANGVCVDID